MVVCPLCKARPLDLDNEELKIIVESLKLKVEILNNEIKDLKFQLIRRGYEEC